MRKSLILIALAGLAACATPGKRTAIGAGGGAAAGAGVGAIMGGWKGAAIGAAVGGVAGGAVGNYLDKQAQELKEVAETTRRTKDGIMVDLKSKLLFTTDSSVLKPEAVELVAKLGDILAKYPDDRIRIAGSRCWSRAWGQSGRSRATPARPGGRRTDGSSCASTCRTPRDRKQGGPRIARGPLSPRYSNI